MKHKTVVKKKLGARKKFLSKWKLDPIPLCGNWAGKELKKPLQIEQSEIDRNKILQSF
jgi:hypothetical protein